MYFLISAILSIELLLTTISISSLLSGAIIPVMMLMKVVLPAPLCPRIDINSLGSISNVKFLIASTLFFEHVVVNVLDRFFILIPSAGASDEAFL